MKRIAARPSMSATHAKGLRRPVWASLECAVAVIAAHALLIWSIALGARTGPRPEARGEPSALGPHEGRDDVVSAFIEVDPRVLSGQRARTFPDIHPPKLKRNELTHPVLLRVSLPKFHVSGAARPDPKMRKATSTKAVDGATDLMLFGRYVNQISARIEEGWTRPRVAPGAMWGAKPRKHSSRATFRCRVRIDQSRAGKVLEVTLVACDSSPQWQVSLVKAIDAASPLPSPPSSAVFERSLVLNFKSPVRPSGSSGRAGAHGLRAMTNDKSNAARGSVK